MKASPLKLYLSYRMGREFYLCSIKTKRNYSSEPANEHSRDKSKKPAHHLGRGKGISVTSHINIWCMCGRGTGQTYSTSGTSRCHSALPGEVSSRGETGITQEKKSIKTLYILLKHPIHFFHIITNFSVLKHAAELCNCLTGYVGAVDLIWCQGDIIRVSRL